MSITVGELLDAAAVMDRQVNLDPAELAQLEYQAKRAGITLGELITCYVRDGLNSDLRINPAMPWFELIEPTKDLVQRKKNRLYWRWHERKISFDRFRKLAAEIDGGGWAIPLYTLHSEVSSD